MSETPSQPPAGWYPDPQRDNKTHYWDGNRWATPLLESIELREGEKAARRISRTGNQQGVFVEREPINTKLNTIGHLAWIVAAIGVLILVLSGGDPVALTAGSSFIIAGGSLWLSWLAVGAIVDAINQRR